MAKNMTRKGLAIGAGFALVSTGLVATPAAALDPVELQPNAGTSYNIPLAEGDYALKAFFSSAAEYAATDKLGFVITDVDGNLDLATSSAAGQTDLTTVAGAIDATDTTDGVTTVITDSTDPGAANATVLELATSATESFSVEIIAFIDNDADNAYDAGVDNASVTRTVNFIASDEISASVDFTAAYFSDDAVEATVTFSPELNLEQTAEATLPGVFTNGTDAFTDTTTQADDFEGSVATYSADVNDNDLAEGFLVLTVTSSDSEEIVEANFEVIDNDLDNVAVEVTENDNVAKASTGATVREGSSSAVFTITAEDSTSDADPIEGVQFTFTGATSGQIDEDGSATVNGEAVDSDGSFDAITATTNADGEIVVTVVATDLAVGDHIDIDWASENNKSGTLTVEVVEAAYSASIVNIVDANDGGSAAGTSGNGLNVGVGGEFAVQVMVADQFGVGADNGDYRVKAAISQSGEDNINRFGTVSNGVGSVEISDRAEDGSQVTAALQLEAYNSNLQTWSNATAVTGNNLGSVYLNPLEAVTAKVVIDEPTAAAISTDALEDVNEKLGDATPDFDGDGVALTGEVNKLVGGSNVVAVPVTVSGPSNLLFNADGVFSLGSITGWADSDGEFSFQVMSNVAGEFEVTVESSGGSETETVEFTGSSTADSIVIDAPDSIMPGYTLNVRGHLLDEFGNGVEMDSASGDTLVVNYDGPGFIVGGSAPDETDADGEFEMVIVLTQEQTTATVTATYDADGSTATTDDAIVVQKSIVVGQAPAGEFNAWTKLNADNTNVKFYAKNPSNQGKIQFFFNGEEIAWHRGTSNTSYEGGALRYDAGMDSYYLVRDVDLVSGIKNVFEIYQDGTRIWRAVKTLD